MVLTRRAIGRLKWLLSADAKLRSIAAICPRYLLLDLSTLRKCAQKINRVHTAFRNETLPAAEVQALLVEFLQGGNVADRHVTFAAPSFLSLEDAKRGGQQSH